MNPFREALAWFGPNGERWINRGAVGPWKACAHGAIVLALEHDGPLTLVNALLNKTARALFPDRIGWTRMSDAAAVNDHPDTTFDDIRALFEKCAVRWEERI